jgi:hypothetical protein
MGLKLNEFALSKEFSILNIIYHLALLLAWIYRLTATAGTNFVNSINCY